ncbi:MAG: hypothetical protein KY460_07990 [Actinobacteria bacterium]|nr:hypothetical protein [Actinomycetota bacterium]
MRWAAGGVVAVLLLVIGVALVPGEDRLAELAADTCDHLDGTNLLTVSVVIGNAIDEAATSGHADDELFDAMWDECPLLMQQIADAVEDL